jgi:hypothetical protein
VLHNAAAVGNIEVYEEVRLGSGMSAEAAARLVDQHGRVPVMSAVHGGHKAMISHLLGIAAEWA